MHDGKWIRMVLAQDADMLVSESVPLWSGWLVYLLECLQAKTDAEHYEEFLRDIKGAITARLEDGRW